MEFTVLASGSSGNASLLRAGGFGLLIDIGLGPRLLASRLHAVGCSMKNVHAVLLSHVHADHWKEKSLRFLRQHGIPLYCHAGHETELARMTPAAANLRAHQLLRLYEFGRDIALEAGLRLRAFELSHDSKPTSGFRLKGHTGAIGYAADLGCWQPALAQELVDVDVLALEFNHDVAMEKNSGREPQLIERILGAAGHLSNEQAAALAHEVLLRSEPGKVKHIVQLHLSRHCNSSILARRAMQKRLQEFVGQVPTVHTAQQDNPGPILRIDDLPPRRTCRAGEEQMALVYRQPRLPGWED